MQQIRLKALRAFAYGGDVVAAGETVDMPAALAAELVANGKATRAAPAAAEEGDAEKPRAKRASRQQQ